MILVEGHADVADLDAFLADVAAIGDAHDCVVQAFDARLVAGERHLERALACASRAIARGNSIARDPAVEVLCYAAGRRQIDDALELGVGEGTQPVVVLVASLAAVEGGVEGGATDGQERAGEEGATEEDAVEKAATERAVVEGAAAEDAAAEDVRELVTPATLERGSELADPERLRAYFDVGERERAATDADLETLVCERVALLTVER